MRFGTTLWRAISLVALVAIGLSSALQPGADTGGARPSTWVRNYATTYSSILSRSSVTNGYDMIQTASFNTCHLAAHRGSRRITDLCVPCCTAENLAPPSASHIGAAYAVDQVHARY